MYKSTVALAMASNHSPDMSEPSAAAAADKLLVMTETEELTAGAPTCLSIGLARKVSHLQGCHKPRIILGTKGLQLLWKGQKIVSNLQ